MEIIYGLLICLLAINLYPSEYGYRWIKLNPFWWFLNTHDPVTGPTHNYFWMGKPLWFRRVMWLIRNPLQNFNNYVIGFADKKELVSQGTLWPLPGHKVKIQPPLFSYRFGPIEGHLGWNPGGKFSLVPIRKSHSKAY